MVLAILQEGVLGLWSQNETEEEIKRKQGLLFSWGYGEEGTNTNPVPFYSMHKGILSQNTFVSLHSDKAEGILFDVEPFYVATTFGLLAIDILTTTEQESMNYYNLTVKKIVYEYKDKW